MDLNEIQNRIDELEEIIRYLDMAIEEMSYFKRDFKDDIDGVKYKLMNELEEYQKWYDDEQTKAYEMEMQERNREWENSRL